jgi:alpha-ketoglutarate-dependent 2,4-dichlorophenoxyacetate dioxygenase
MTLDLHPIHAELAAEVAGLDAGRPPDAATVQEMWRAIARYPVLVLRDQHLDDERLKAFAACFGPLEIGRAAVQPGRRRLKIPEIGDISNLDEDGRIRARDDRRRLDSLGNRLWHTDASYMPVPVVLGMLYAVAVPPPSPQRLVRRHPESGRKTLYLSAHASHIEGWPVPEGRLLLRDLRRATTLDRGSTLEEAA